MKINFTAAESSNITGTLIMNSLVIKIFVSGYWEILVCTLKYFFKKEKWTQCYFSKFHSKDNFDQMLSTTLAFIEEVSNESGDGWLIFLRNNFFQKIMKKTVDRKS